MARFVFKAYNAEGAMLDGEVVAAGEREAARSLERRGLAVLSIEEAGTAPARQGRVRRLRPVDTTLMLHELATLLQSGVGLAEAVASQASVSRHPRLSDALEQMSTGLRRGLSFSQALSDSGLVLPTYVLTLVRSGEKSGQLGKALQDAVAQMEYDEQVRTEIRQALTYPAVLVAAGVAAVVMMFAFVVPKFAMLLDRGADLPWLGWAVLTAGMFARQWWWLLLGLAVVAGVLVARQFGDPSRRARVFQWLEGLPVIGPWRVEAETAAWSRILATLLGNRVPLLDALALAQGSVRSPRRLARLEEAARTVRAGGTLADALEEQATLSPTGYNLVRVGERSGELPAMLDSLARLSENSGRARMKQFLALLEPAAILLIGSAIGTIMVGIILAITSANDIIA